jgi:hypothetical protein
MDKIIKFLDSLNDEELLSFEKELKDGNIHKFIDQKKEYFKIRGKTCSTCGNKVDEDCMLLIYGDPRTGFRKKAHFCGSDCMEYFVKKNIIKDNYTKNESGKKNAKVKG